MIVVDTNVLSEPLKALPNPRVIQWLLDNDSEIAITSISIAELFHGARRLPQGKRRDSITVQIERTLQGARTRLLPFDDAAARHYADIRSNREATGHSVSVEDTMIVSICRAHGYAVATRNTRDFEGADVEIINPWGG